MSQQEHVTRGEIDATRRWIDERFRTMTWKLGVAAFLGGALSNAVSDLHGPIVTAAVAAAGAAGYAVKVVLVALLHR